MFTDRSFAPSFAHRHRRVQNTFRAVSMLRVGKIIRFGVGDSSHPSAPFGRGNRAISKAILLFVVAHSARHKT